MKYLAILLGIIIFSFACNPEHPKPWF